MSLSSVPIRHPWQIAQEKAAIARARRRHRDQVRDFITLGLAVMAGLFVLETLSFWIGFTVGGAS